MRGRAGWTADGRPLVDGRAAGTALVLSEPLSFWGGVETTSGRIVDARHPERGRSIVRRVLVMRSGRGSSSSSSVLAETIRLGTGPAAILLAEPDEILALGALVARLVDAAECPVILLLADDYRSLASDDAVVIRAGGRVEVGWRASGSTR